MIKINVTSAGCICNNRCTITKRCPCKHAGVYCSFMCHPGHSCTNSHTPNNESEVIDVEMYKCKLRSSSENWIQVGSVILKNTQKHILTSNNEWFDDCIISAAQHLLKQKCPHIRGLQPPTLANALSFEQALGCPYLQVLLENNNHWVVISTVGCPSNTVRIFDSMNSMNLSTANKRVVADFLRTDSDFIVLEYIHVQYQIGASDCGAFAIAFATSICFAEDPHVVIYEQNNLRNHLKICLEKGDINKFPRRKIIRLPSTEKVVQSLAIYCICRLPNDGKPMIKCNKCKRWYHFQCVNLNSTDLDKYKYSIWNCYKCT